MLWLILGPLACEQVDCVPYDPGPDCEQVELCEIGNGPGYFIRGYDGKEYHVQSHYNETFALYCDVCALTDVEWDYYNCEERP